MVETTRAGRDASRVLHDSANSITCFSVSYFRDIGRLLPVILSEAKNLVVGEDLSCYEILPLAQSW